MRIGIWCFGSRIRIVCLRGKGRGEERGNWGDGDRGDWRELRIDSGGVEGLLAVEELERG